ncbi:MAG TPA: cation-transporting P-type ATPase [Solirubrobacterales bacterium]|nr:cation-transporting P-type ATPase [Solirubrobacterales bacterium]
MKRQPQEGLSEREAQRRLRQHGPNAIVEAKGPSNVRLFLANLIQLFALLLWVGAVLALAAGLPELSAAIVAVIVVNAVFAFVQEYRAEQAVAALRRMLPIRVRVRRDGGAVEIPNEEVVPGDVLLFAPGDRVAGDADLLASSDLRVDESTLTGESSLVAPEGRVFAGTYVTAGAGEALVTATGMATRLGRIAELAQQTRRERSPLERELDRLTRVVALIAVSIGVLFVVLAGFVGMDMSDRFVFAIGVTVALVPEGLLPTVTLSLALATQRMAKRNALVRRLSSVETLGETTVICTDKTGTLTENQMTVQRLWSPGGQWTVEGAGYEPFGRFRCGTEIADPAPLRELLRAGLLCNDARLIHGEGGWSVLGDPTEGALVVLAEKGGLRHEQEAALAPRLSEVPFSSERKRMTTVHRVAGERVAYVKGAAELVLPRTTLSEEARAEVAAAGRAMERDALRVLVLARRVLPADGAEEPDEIECDLELLGLVGMLDPPRPEVPEAIRRCRQAGIRIIMVTGDSGPTAEAIARAIGLLEGEVHVIAGTELTAIDDAELRRRFAERHVIFARIDPEQKLRLARLLREDREVVAMTGDGVNDAPALKQADIGIAMGSGTEVAKEAADLILIDDNFASVVAAVEEGRAIYDNIRRFAGYHFCSNAGELVPFLVWGVSGGAVPLPLVVMQVLAIDLGTDQLPAIALGTEGPEPGAMARPPRRRSEHLLNRAVIARVFGWIGPFEALAAMTSFLFAYWLAGWRPWEALADSGTLYREATTMTMAGIVMAQVGAALSWRTNRLSLRSVGIFSNRLLLVGIAVEVAMIALLAYTPGLDEVFHTSGLQAWQWLLLLAWPPLVVGAEEVRKAVVRRRG